MSQEQVIGSYFAAMRKGADAEDEIMALFADDVVYVEPFTGATEPAVGRAAVRDRLRTGWQQPLPDLELDVLGIEIDGASATSRWECRSPALPGPVRGTDRYEFADGRITRLEVELDTVPAAAARATMHHDIEIAARPDEVWAAIASQRGVRGWWTSTAEIEPGGDATVGGCLRVWFADRTIAMAHTIDQCDVDGGLLRYTCTAHERNDDWFGTTLTWTLNRTPSEAGDHGPVTLALAHSGWDPDADHYDECDHGWTRFLESIRQLVESGTGNPVD